MISVDGMRMESTTDEAFEARLRYLRDSRGSDFTGYKRTSLMRRVRHRMDQAGCTTVDEYLDFLRASSDEFTALFNTILINVTSFFRDPDAWEFVSAEVIPRLLGERGPNAPIRVWSAACASGQEAYTLAMLFAEALAPDGVRNRVKIYATDVDEDALGEARRHLRCQGGESVPPDLLARHFAQANGRYAFRKDLRRAVIFGATTWSKTRRSRVDLLVCRNSLMYLNAESQRNAVGRLHFALAPRGTLFLGHAEMLLSHGDRFTPVNLKHRIFRKAAGVHGGADRYDPSAAFYERNVDLPGLTTARDLAFRASPVAQLVITGEDTVAMINHEAETTFGLSARDIGLLLRDLEVSYRAVALRACLEQAKVQRRSARIQDVKWQRTAGRRDRLVRNPREPARGRQNGLLGGSIVFFDVTATRALLDKVVRTRRQLETAYEELRTSVLPCRAPPRCWRRRCRKRTVSAYPGPADEPLAS